MKRLSLLLLMGLLSTACSDDEHVFTWGDLSLQMSNVFCDKLVSCGVGTHGEWERQCAAHTKFHLCELPDNCDTPLAPEAEAVMADCLDAFSDKAFNDPESEVCYVLGWFSIVPDVCYDALNFDPALMDDGNTSSTANGDVHNNDRPPGSQEQ